MPSDAAKITNCWLSVHEPVKIMVRCDDESEKDEPHTLYTYFSDEKSYDPCSFIGMTWAAATTRCHDDDRKYLQSPARKMYF